MNNKNTYILTNEEALMRQLESANKSISPHAVSVSVGKSGNAINYSEADPELFSKVFDCVKMSCDPGEYLVNGVKKFSIIHIYDNQMRAAANILCAYIKGKRIVTLLAQTQVGKTGVISAVIQTILNGYKILAECGFYFGKDVDGNDVDVSTISEENGITWRYLNQTVSSSKLPTPSESTYPGSPSLEKETIKNELEMIQPSIGIDEIPALPKVTKVVIKQHEDGRITGVNPYDFMRVKAA